MTKRDVDETILDALRHRGHLSPSNLEKGCTSQGIPRPTYFRHLKKLKKLMQIEETREVDDEGKSHRKFRYLSPNELAAAKEIEFYLAEIDSSNEEIQGRGLHFFLSLCNQRRVAWYFSPRSNPKFKSHHDVTAFFQKKFLGRSEHIRLEFLRAIKDMIRSEPPDSLWRVDVIRSCQKTLEDIALGRGNVELRRCAIQILNLIQDPTLVDLAFHILEETMIDAEFSILLPDIKEVLINSKEAKAKKLSIRERLDELSVKKEQLKTRVQKLLEGAPP